MQLGGADYHKDLPTTSESEKDIKEKQPAALHYLQQTNNLDLAEMLGLDPKGEN